MKKGLPAPRLPPCLECSRGRQHRAGPALEEEKEDRAWGQDEDDGDHGLRLEVRQVQGFLLEREAASRPGPYFCVRFYEAQFAHSNIHPL